MGTTVECVAMYVWEQLWNVWHYIHGNNCGKSGTIFMGTALECVAMYVWEKCEIAGIVCTGTNMKRLALYSWE
jgi:uncharacterized membrane protein